MMKIFVNLFALAFIYCSATILIASSDINIKKDFIQHKVLKGHDFTKLPENAKFRPRHLLVRFAPKSDHQQRNKTEKLQILSDLGNSVIKYEFDTAPGLVLLELTDNLPIKDALKKYNSRNDVLYAEPDYEINFASLFPNDVETHNLWGMNNTGRAIYNPVFEYKLEGVPDADIDAWEAWRLNNTNEVIVAIVDSGVDYNHIDLHDNMWRNPNEEPNDANYDGYPGIAGFDDDGDSLIDEDSQGNSRFLADGITPNPSWTNDLPNDDDENGFEDDIYGCDIFDNNGDPMDYLEHGTHIAGTIGAKANNESGVTGVCWNAKLMAVNVSHSGQEFWPIFASNAVKGIDYAVKNNAKIINASWGGSNDVQALKDIIEEVGNQGVIIVASAGNEGFSTPRYPALYDLENIISVLSTDNNDNLSVHYNWGDNYSWASNYGQESVDLGAPGSNILSCALNNEYKYYSGTSMASPHVVGACALVWAANPLLTHLQVKQIIMDTVDPLEDLTGKCVTGGRLNLCNAVLAAGPLNVILDDNLDLNSDPNKISCNEEITYSIFYENPLYNPADPNSFDTGTTTNTVLYDYLPDQVDFVNASPTGSYDEPNHVYRWNLPDLEPNDCGQVFLTVRVNQRAESGGTIHNMAAIKANIQNASTISGNRCYTPLDCWSNTIYVDANATGYNNGSCWQDAFTEIYRALDQAQQCCTSPQIRVAEGTYRPHIYWNDGCWLAEPFEIPSNVAIYGGFPTGGGNEKDRNPWQNQTILHGNSEHWNNNYFLDLVVQLKNCNEKTVLDGFTINDSCGIDDVCGIYIENGNPTVSHNFITAHQDYGIYLDSGSAKITHNKIVNNGMGVYACNTDAPTIINNWIYKNNLTGLFLDDVSSNATVRNNTIAYNQGDGVVKWGGSGDPNIVMLNCIVWKNIGEQLVNCPAKYSCIYDPVNDPNCDSPNADQNGNVSAKPLFFSEIDDDFHLEPNSSCIDTGEPESNYFDEIDIDGNNRIIDGGFAERVDMGADEVCNGSDTNYADFNNNGHVDLFDFAKLANAWLNEPPELNPIYDLNNDDTVNTIDLSLFADEWFWRACWNYPD